VDSLERLLELQPDVVAEAAGHEALRQHGSACLSASITLVLQSVGALADPTLESALRAAAEAGDVSAQWLQEGLDAGSDRERRPGKAAPGRSCHRQTSRGFRPRGSSPERRCIEDPPGEAARQYPQNANVAAAVALAGLGLDRSEVVIVSDFLRDDQPAGDRDPGLVRSIPAEDREPALGDQSQNLGDRGYEPQACARAAPSGDRRRLSRLSHRVL
jgi:homoserine dehydrogenase-like protein/aspartate dehydrogenase family protein